MLTQPSGSLALVQHLHSIAMIAMTHKRDGYLALGITPILHVTHPLAITSASELIQRAGGQRGGEEVERGGGGGGVKRGIRRTILAQHYRRKSLICCLFNVEWMRSYSVKWIPFCAPSL